GSGPFALGLLLLAGDLLPGEEHVHRPGAAGLAVSAGGRARARTKLLLGRRGRAGTRDQGTESSTESSLLRHGRCPSEKSIAAGVSAGRARTIASRPRGAGVRERGGSSAHALLHDTRAHRSSSDRRSAPSGRSWVPRRSARSAGSSSRASARGSDRGRPVPPARPDGYGRRTW